MLKQCATELQRFAEVAEDVARQAGKSIKEARENKGFNVDVKSGIDLVTSADRDSEKLIIGTLKAKFPEHAFIGEESSAPLDANSDGSLKVTDQPTWIIDPIDGTTNYVHGMYDVVISIALSMHKELVLGVIYNPFLDEMYIATKGGGAFCNGVRIHVSSTQELEQAAIINNVGACRDLAFLSACLTRVEGVMSAPCRAMRLGGSAAMNCCYVACGRLDVFWETGFGGPWDVAAGFVLITEAGGVVKSAPTGGKFLLKPGKGDILVGNEAITTAVASRLRQATKSASVWSRLDLLGAFALGAVLSFAASRTNFAR